ncbi:Bulb-type lectin domain containing protein [Parasponia andersonii]|uniref:Bulb-type lectin domain containing protein n=1 Tax=Parasponia andersonii TaxID=3476 RepID=A0A2P5E4N3_PARAD|nr:Bulb-type lectin domain containing protein [Parasponia andersonii]
METKFNLRFMVVLFQRLLEPISALELIPFLPINPSLKLKPLTLQVKSSPYYIGMWYIEFLKHSIVWVANRDKSVSDVFFPELKISDGNLVLFDESKIPVRSTNVKNSNISSVQAVLLDNGNLVLNDGSNLSIPS